MRSSGAGLSSLPTLVVRPHVRSFPHMNSCPDTSASRYVPWLDPPSPARVGLALKPDSDWPPPQALTTLKPPSQAFNDLAAADPQLQAPTFLFHRQQTVLSNSPPQRDRSGP